VFHFSENSDRATAEAALYIVLIDLNAVKKYGLLRQALRIFNPLKLKIV
jgi:hypothetical protein